MGGGSVGHKHNIVHCIGHLSAKKVQRLKYFNLQLLVQWLRIA